MIIKFHSRGRGCGSGSVDYLLGKDRDREGAIRFRRPRANDSTD